jgi:putative endonuclease
MTQHAKQMLGQRSNLAGQSAEDAVARHYVDLGYELAARRWRGGVGEVDLIFRDGEACIFVEVKKSRSFARAADLLRPAQTRRFIQAATVFVGDEPKGQLTEMRFDVALVDAAGTIKILENVLMAA